MAALDVYYARGHGDNPITVSTPDEVDALIDRVRAESPETAPILMEVHISGDPYTQGLDVGINGDRGVLRYSGRDWPEGVYSTGDGLAEGKPLAYFYMDTCTEFPPNAEVPVDTVRQAVRDFLATDGDRPSGIVWQPER
ncbi:Imm1 family immunity protein [Allokutzneria oryzae]|uniref:Imm1 family immunity protein n=1 Tax=Allokutzneria oryzae TaxID=1378989 RepID=A0ABV6A036_9PSEU